MADNTNCQQMIKHGKYGLGIKECFGCKRMRDIKICHSGDIYYLGVTDNEGPYCRATPYLTKAQADVAIVMVNDFIKRFC